MFRVLLFAASVLLLAGNGSCFRRKFTASNKEAEEQRSNDTEVPYQGITILGHDSSMNFSFMTGDLRYQARQPTVWGWMKRALFGGRRIFSTLKDEIVKGHSCNGVGARDQTYYASSLCYWIPEIKAPPSESNQGTKGPGLKWLKGEPGKQLCKKFEGSGQCVKCAVCHNNGRTKTGDVTATAFQENDIVPLGPSCMKELQIEGQVNTEFDGNHTDLKNNKTDCETREREYNEAVKNLRDNLDLQQRLQNRLNALPGEINNQESRTRQLEQQKGQLEGVVWNARRYAEHPCHPWRGETWYRWLGYSSVSAQQVLSAWPTFICSRPSRPWCNEFEDLHCAERMRQWHRELQEYEECVACRNAKRSLENAVVNVRRKQTEIDASRQREAQLRDEMARKQRELNEAKSREPGLRDALSRAEARWLPEETRCREVYKRYTEMLAAWMRQHVPLFYSRSCEKACLDNVDHGCGVMEGVMPGEIWRVGNDDFNPGLKVVCSPPYASFVRTPVKYGAEAETEMVLCGHLFNNTKQRPRRAQSIGIQGYLSKRERLWWRWRQRYFIFEHGDAVRSAQIRYWDKKPDSDGAIERGVKAIIVWDARDVYPESGRKYWWRDGSECFRLRHFYRDFRLCVPGTTANTRAVRDQWVSAIKANIRFPSKYR